MYEILLKSQTLIKNQAQNSCFIFWYKLKDISFDISPCSLPIAYIYVLSHVLLCNPLDYSPLGSSVHRISQARILEWAAISYSRGLPKPLIEPMSPALADRFVTIMLPGKTRSMVTSNFHEDEVLGPWTKETQDIEHHSEGYHWSH